MSHINPFLLGWANYFKMMKMIIDTSGTSFRFFKITMTIDGKPSGTSFRWLFTGFLRRWWDIILEANFKVLKEISPKWDVIQSGDLGAYFKAKWDII